MYSMSDVGQAGENHVARWLQSQGFTVRQNTQLPGSTDIEAANSAKRLLVQVKSAVYPGAPATLSSDEVRNITSRAARIGAEAWVAQVVLNQQLQVQGQMAWTKLN